MLLYFFTLVHLIWGINSMSIKYTLLQKWTPVYQMCNWRLCKLICWRSLLNNLQHCRFTGSINSKGQNEHNITYILWCVLLLKFEGPLCTVLKCATFPKSLLACGQAICEWNQWKERCSRWRMSHSWVNKNHTVSSSGGRCVPHQHQRWNVSAHYPFECGAVPRILYKDPGCSSPQRNVHDEYLDCRLSAGNKFLHFCCTEAMGRLVL